MSKQTNKSEPTTISQYNEEMKRHMGALMESFQSEVKIIAEQYGDIKSTLKEHGEKLDSHTEMIGGLMIDVQELKQDVSVLKTDVAVLKTDVAVLKTDVAEIKQDLKQKVDQSDFVKVEHRVRVLEAR